MARDYLVACERIDGTTIMGRAYYPFRDFPAIQLRAPQIVSAEGFMKEGTIRRIVDKTRLRSCIAIYGHVSETGADPQLGRGPIEVGFDGCEGVVVLGR